MFIRTNNKPLLVWITGLSGSGKTTLASQLAERLKELRSDVVHLDGDQIRSVLGHNAFDGKALKRVDRLSLAFQYKALAKLLYDQNFVVIVSTISLFSEIHQANRNDFERYAEIYIDSDISELKAIDNRSVYSSSGNDLVVGLDLNYDEPANPEMTLISRSESPTAMTNKVFEYLNYEGLIYAS
jgi:adenylylsulfate kinase-like enzyme